MVNLLLRRSGMETMHRMTNAKRTSLNWKSLYIKVGGAALISIEAALKGCQFIAGNNGRQGIN
jgi:hypothetical protein